MRRSIDFEVDLEFPTDFECWDPSMWNLFSDLPLNDVRKSEIMKYRLSSDEIELLNAWDKLVGKFKQINDGARLPGFPLWSDIWGKKPIYEYDKNSPKWKKDFENKNRNFYLEHKQIIDNWLVENPIIRESSPSKRKLEWQAQDMNSLWEGLLHFRPSGIRVKKPNYVPALVAITQTTIIGKFKRRITPSEGAMLQGLGDNFDFGNQSDQASYKQLGNGVAVGAVYQVVKALAKRDEQILKITNPKILKKIMLAPNSHRLYQVQNTRKVANVSVPQ
jgi:DNA (cytosine-5)-methyltransferase 1